jgi:PAS domain S-box-containing protein
MGMYQKILDEKRDSLIDEEKTHEIKKIFYDKLFEIFPDIVYIADFSGKIIDISSNLLENYGIKDKKEIIGTNFYDFIDIPSLEPFKRDILELIQKGVLKDKLYKIKNKKGINLIGKVSACLIKDEKGTPKYVIGMFKDISEEEQLKSELNNSKEMFQLVLDNIPQFIFWKDNKSVYLGCNKNFARIAGVEDPKKIIGKTDRELPWKKSEAESFYETDRWVMESDKPEYHIIESVLQADGKEKWLDINKIPLHNSEREVVGLLGTFEDITENVLTKKAIEKSEKKYRDSYNKVNFYKDIFSHDISNILQNIGSANDLIDVFLNSPDKSKELTYLVSVIKEQVLRGAKLIDNIQKLSEIEETKINLKKINLSYVLKDSIKVLNKWVSNSNNLKIDIDLSDPDITVQANDLLNDVFQNILINAVKYNDNPIIEILIKIQRVFENAKKYVKVEFSDNGIGIEDPRKDEIFLRAYNQDKSISGLGLGLSLAKKIIERYNGEIWVEDKVQGDYFKGCKFVILIPE